MLVLLPWMCSPAEDRNCSRWDVMDLTFRSETEPRQPSSAVFYADFSGPVEQEMRVWGFHNGGAEWIIRFSPPTPGDWQYVVRSDVPGLNGRTGTIHAEANTNPDRHGPLMLYPDRPQHFFYADGTPCLLLSFECDWLFALDLDNPEDIPRTKKLVDTIADHGFNQVIMNVYAHDVSWKKDPALEPQHDFGEPHMWPFGGSNGAPDFRTLNTEYFKRLDRVIAYLNEKHIFAHLMIYVWNKQVTWPSMYSRADEYYFYHVTARYQAFPNVVWDVAKEALAYGRCDDVYIHNRIKRLRKWDGHGRLITVHDYGYCSRFPDRVDFISVQSWRSDLYAHMRDVRSRHPRQPVLNIEHGGYERGPYLVFSGDYTDPVTCLKRAYDCLFAGTYPTYYWQCAAWNVVIPDPMERPEEKRPRLKYYRHLKNLFGAFDFSRFEPSQDLSSSGFALTNEADIRLFLVPDENEFIHVHLKDATFRTTEASWYDPLTGQWTETEKMELESWHGFQSPWPDRMAVLMLKKIQ